MKVFTTISIFLSAISVSGQVFENDSLKNLVRKGADHIYNASADSAHYYIDLVDEAVPNHPAVPLMRAMTILWTNIPTITEDLFLEMQDHLYYAIELAESRDPNFDDPEMIFFAMASHGLLAEYYADQDYNLKAVGEANRAYSLMKKGFSITDSYPEFLLTTGLYNYFREKYPEKHPIYKPLLWFFRSGDIELGLQQLEKACQVSVLTQVEAYIYLSYIYLRYEYKPNKAQEYLEAMVLQYPNNIYAKAKYLESLANPDDFDRAPVEIIYELTHHENPYYKLAGNVFLGYLEETVIQNNEKAEFAYRRGLMFGEQLNHHGEYFKGLGYLGLGKLLILKGEFDEAKKMLDQAMKYAETDLIRKEARELLSTL